MAHPGPERAHEADFFTANIVNAVPKDDIISMEHPIFSLAKRPDMKIRRYEHKGYTVEVTPSMTGLATIWDKDILLFITAQVIEGLNRGSDKAKERYVRFRAYDYLKQTHRGTSGREYRQFREGLDRLQGTIIRTTRPSRGQGHRIERTSEPLIGRWRIVELSATDTRDIAVEIELAASHYELLQAREVLTIHRTYFLLSSSLERRLYELARKHCGRQPTWTISALLLCKKSGAQGGMRNFRRALREISARNQLPEYRVRFDEESENVVFESRDFHRVDASTLAERLLKAMPG